MDEYQTEEYVEGEIESCELQEFRSDEPPRVVEVYAIDDEDDPSYDVIAEIDGEGDVLWQVTHPSGGDFVRFAGDIDGLEHGGGHFYRLDTDCSIRIRVSAISRKSATETGATRKPRLLSLATRPSAVKRESASRRGDAPTPYRRLRSCTRSFSDAAKVPPTMSARSRSSTCSVSVGAEEEPIRIGSARGEDASIREGD